MRSAHHVGKPFLIVGALILVVVGMVPTVPQGPAHLAEAAPRAASTASAEQRKVTLGDTSIDGPALWTSNPSAPTLGLASLLAWTGSDVHHSLNIMRSSDGVTYGGKVTFAESSASRPAVVAAGTPPTIVLAWTGIDPRHSLNLLCQGPACGAASGNYKKLTFTESSFTSPALTRFGSRFLLAWAGVDPNHSLNIWPFSLTTSGSGFQMGVKTVLRQFSSASQPSLSLNPQNNQLVLSWAATSGHLAFASSTNGTTWSLYGLNATSAVGPSSFSVATSGMPRYWMSWTTTDTAHAVDVRFTQDFPFWPVSNVTALGETALGGPALGYVGNVGQLLLTWTGTDSTHHLNIATIVSAGTRTLDQRIDAHLAGLSTAQLIGQTLMMSVCATSYSANLANFTQALTQWDVGSALIYTSCNNGPTTPSTAAGLQQLDQALQSHANRAGSLLLAIDEEGGTVDRLAPYYGATPSARQLAATGNPQNAYTQAQTDAGRMRALGLNVDFAPVADVDQGGGVGSSRTFGASVTTVTTYAGAFLDGLQQHGVAGTLKHWPGLGAATGNPDYILPTINQTQAQMRALDFAPFQRMLYQQPGMIMVTTVMAPAFDAHAPADLSPTLVNGILRGQLGYQGVIVTDALGAQGLIIYMRQQGYSNATQAIAEASVRAFLAGDDLLLCPLSQASLQAVITAMTQAVGSGRISQARLRASVHRIIALKVQLGLLTLP